MLHALFYAIHKSADGFGLVAHGYKGCLKFEVHRLFFLVNYSERVFYYNMQKKSRSKESDLETEAGTRAERSVYNL